MKQSWEQFMEQAIIDHLDSDHETNPQAELLHPCYLCGKYDAQIFLTIWPTYKPGELRWICRNHLLLGDIIVDAHTGNPIHMYGNQELWPDENQI